MKRFLLAAVLAAASSPLLAADVAVSISIGQPGFYGRIDIGGYPQPQVIYTRPIVIEPVPAHRRPIYLRVPPGHAKHWKKHCHEYHACGERVYFVRDDWYDREYVPRYQEKHRGHGDDHHDGHKDDHRGNHGNDHQGDDREKGRYHY